MPEGQGYLTQAQAHFNEAANLSKIGGYGAIASGIIDFGVLRNQKAEAKNRAAAIELQAEQRANILLESFNASMGNLQFSAARRGVKAGEGSVMRNIELSSKDLGEDIQARRREASIKAGKVKTQAKTDFSAGVVGSLSGGTEGFLKGMEGFKRNKSLADLLGGSNE